jgi:hypothetical protein
MTSQNRNSSASIRMMQDKTQQWIDKVLAMPWIWLMQLDGIRTRIGKSAPQAILPNPTLGRNSQDYASGKPDYQRRVLWHRSSHLGIKAVIAMTNKLLMHYGCILRRGNSCRLCTCFSSQNLASRSPHCRSCTANTDSWSLTHRSKCYGRRYPSLI